MKKKIVILLILGITLVISFLGYIEQPKEITPIQTQTPTPEPIIAPTHTPISIPTLEPCPPSLIRAERRDK